MNKAQAREMSKEVQLALEAVATKFDMTVEVRGSRYDPGAGTFTPRVEFKSADSERLEFELFAPSFNIDPALYGATFKVSGKTYTVAALNPRAPKYPLLGVDSSGKRFKFTNAVLERVARERKSI